MSGVSVGPKHTRSDRQLSVSKYTSRYKRLLSGQASGTNYLVSLALLSNYEPFSSAVLVRQVRPVSDRKNAVR